MILSRQPGFSAFRRYSVLDRCASNARWGEGLPCYPQELPSETSELTDRFEARVDVRLVVERHDVPPHGVDPDAEPRGDLLIPMQLMHEQICRPRCDQEVVQEVLVRFVEYALFGAPMRRPPGRDC